MRCRWLWLLCLAGLLVMAQPAQSDGADPQGADPQGADPRDELHPTPWFVDFLGQRSTLDGQPLPVGAVVRAYDPTGVLAGRATVALSGWYLMPVYGDDPMTALDEGAVSGDRITFTVDGCPAVPLGPDPPIWAEAGRRVEVELAATCAPVDTVHLRPGSNLISLPRIPADSRLEAVLRGIAGKWRRVWAWDACAGKWKHAAADAPSWANTWQSIDYRYGFWIDVIEDTTLQVSGGFAPSGSEIPLCEGWNLVGAPLQAVVNVEAAWAGVPWDAAWTYRDGAWQPITPGGGGVWEPSRGYWIHVTTVAPPPLRVP